MNIKLQYVYLQRMNIYMNLIERKPKIRHVYEWPSVKALNPNIGSQHEKNNLSSLSLQHRSSWLHECDETSPIDELNATNLPSTTPNVTTNHASRAYDTELDTELQETEKLSF
jgi:hypothetical protein